MKICTKCGQEFPRSVIIAGKRRNLNNRSCCLECWPFGKKRVGENHQSYNAGAVYHGTKKNGRKLPYDEWSDLAKDDVRAKACWRGKNRKQELVRLKGGECKKCGYDKCLRSLTFHHRDPSEKNMELSSRELQSKQWKVILAEADKCDLMCFNCHMELEEKDLAELKYAAYREKYAGLL